jgi:hypothetical protein
LVKNRTLVISEYDFNAVHNEVLHILDSCSRDNWNDSCAALQRYFLWEYEDYTLE